MKIKILILFNVLIVGMIATEAWHLGFIGQKAIAQTPPPVLQKAEFQFQLRGYCLAYSKNITGPGGHGRSENFPQAVPQELLQKREVALAIDLKSRPFADKYEGFTLRLVNGTPDAVDFSASDSRLAIVQEAQDEQGVWKEVEYLPRSWCGNSYHTLRLRSQECWEFAAPRYSGPVKTKLRFKFTHAQKILYSDAFDGGIHPEQFSIMQGHQPRGLMDPYKE